NGARLWRHHRSVGLRDHDVSRLFLSLPEFHREQVGTFWHPSVLRLSLLAAGKFDGPAGLVAYGRDCHRLGTASMLSADVGERTLCRIVVSPGPQRGAVSLSLSPVSAVLRLVCSHARTVGPLCFHVEMDREWTPPAAELCVECLRPSRRPVR